MLCHWVAAAPLCAAEGTVAAEPGRSARFTGRGYHGHHFGTAPATRWSYCRAVFDGRTIAFSAAGAEAVVIEAGAAGIHHSTVAMEFTAASLPSVIDMQPVGVKLERPRVIGGGSPVRVLYEVSGPVHPGSRRASRRTT